MENDGRERMHAREDGQLDQKVRGTAPDRAGWREKVAALSASWHQKERTNERTNKQTNK